jgi:Dolichyl-phosphate-mannose-protein mannosyltransferase
VDDGPRAAEVIATATAAPGAVEDAADKARPGQPWLTRRREVALVLAALLVGLALRVAIGATDDAPTTDETAYLRSGTALVEGHGFVREGRPELHFPPFVPLLTGAAGKALGDPHTGTVVMTTLCSALLVLPLSLLGRRLAGAAAGVATAWVAALTPALSTTLTSRGAGSEAEYMLLMVGALWYVVSASARAGVARLWRVALAGLLVGLAYLSRPEGLFVAVPLGLAVAVFASGPVRPLLRSGVGALAGRAVRAVPLLVAFGLPILICVAPYAGYLHAHTGKWQLSAKTQDASIEAWRAVAGGDREKRDSVLWALDDSGLRFNPERTSLVTLAKNDPRGYAGIVGTNAHEMVSELTLPEHGQLLSWLLIPAPLWILAGVGAWRVRKRRVAWLVGAVAALPALTALAFFVQPRYLFLVVGLGTVFLGVALATMSQRWRVPVAAAVFGLLVLSTAQGFSSPAAGWWHPSDASDQEAAGRWLAEHTGPDARIMTRSMVVEYFARRPAMAIPYAELPEVVGFGRHYGADYLVLDWYTAVRLRPQLEFLRRVDRAPGLRLAAKVRAEGHTSFIFAFDPPTTGDRPMGPPLGFVGDG